MTKQPVDLNFCLTLKPEEALNYFENKGYILPAKLSEGWQDVWQEAHAKAFTVARVTNMDVLEDIRGMIHKSLEEGLTFHQFKKDLKPKLQKRGWWGIVKDESGTDVQLGSVRRLKTIYDTNLRTSYMAGRYKTMLENAENRPYWMYDAKEDGKTRPAHKALNGKVFKFDDPFWDTHYPPNGWHCRCNVTALNENNLQDKNLKVENTKNKFYTDIKEVSGEEKSVTVFKTTDAIGNPIHVSTDAGWDYNVGKAVFKPNLEKYPYNVAKQYCQGVVTGKPFEHFYNLANSKADECVNIVKKEGMKTNKIRSEAVKHLYNNMPKSEKNIFEHVAILDKTKKTILKSETQAVKFSLESLSKNIINHPELSIKDYYIIPEIVDKTELLIYSSSKGEQVICFVEKAKYYKATIKTTTLKDENYLQSFHVVNIDAIKRDKNKKGVQIIFDNLTLK